MLLMLLGLGLPAWGSDKPNILFIAVDDLKPLLGCYGHNEIKSPHIDRLAASGTVFLNNACQQSVCAPSRASLMTGCYPDTTRVYDLKTQMRDMNPTILTLPQYFKQQGYETTGTGKIYDPRSVDKEYDKVSWSIPHRQYPSDQFYAKGMVKPLGGYRDPAVQKDRKAYNAYLKANKISAKNKTATQEARLKYMKAKPVSECLDVPDDAYQDGAVANSAMDQLETLAKGDKPFFLAVGFFKPHLPFVAPKKYWDLYDPKQIKLASFQQMPKGTPEFAFQDSWELRNYTGVPSAGPIPKKLQLEMLHGYRACVSYTDTLIGKILDKLDALDLSRKTIVVLWGDHGWHLGDHGMFCKHSNFEQAVRSPLIIAAPSQRAKGVKSDSPSEFVDIFPTLCELTGLHIPATVEGKSLVPILENPQAMVREAALEQFPRNSNMMGYTLRDKRYRYVKWVKMDYYQGERTGSLAGCELYDYQTDPLETVNLAVDPAYQELIDRFEALFKKRGIAQTHYDDIRLEQ